MTCLFQWPAKAKAAGPALGDRRVRTKLVILPKKLGNEWRWLGVEPVWQEFQRYRVCPPEMPAMDVVGWRDIGWED